MRNGFVVSCSVLCAAAMLTACSGGGSTAKPAATTAGGGSAGLLSSRELTTLVAAAAKEKFKVSYTDGNGDTLRYAQDGAGNVMQGTADAETFGSKTATISCAKNARTFRCTRASGALGAADNPFTSVVTLLQTYLSGLAGDVGRQSTRTIAGRSAQCLTFSARDLSGNIRGTVEVAEPKVSATYCIDETTGATLEVSQTDRSGTSTTSLVVTDFGVPTAADFVPPTAPTPLPSS
jgi:hypothetical protein